MNEVVVTDINGNILFAIAKHENIVKHMIIAPQEVIVYVDGEMVKDAKNIEVECHD